MYGTMLRSTEAFCGDGLCRSCGLAGMHKSGSGFVIMGRAEIIRDEQLS